MLVGVSINGTHDRTSLSPVCVDNILIGTLVCTARNMPKRQSPAPNARRINRNVGTSRNDLITPVTPNRTIPAGRTIPCQMESSHEGKVSAVQSAVVTSPATSPVASSNSENPSMLENAG
jgi:hypothetical protein